MEDLRALFKALDSDRSGKISKAEFLADMEDDPSQQTSFVIQRFRRVLALMCRPFYWQPHPHPSCCRSLCSDFRGQVIFLYSLQGSGCGSQALPFCVEMR